MSLTSKIFFNYNITPDETVHTKIILHKTLHPKLKHVLRADPMGSLHLETTSSHERLLAHMNE